MQKSVTIWILGLFFISLAGAAIPADCDSSMIAY
jgi:hypothetical protein